MRSAAPRSRHPIKRFLGRERSSDKLGCAVLVRLPFAPPDELARQVLADESARRTVDLHQPEARHAALHGSREIHRRLYRHAVRAQLRIDGIRVVRRERDRCQAVAVLVQETPVVIQPRMLDRRCKQLDIGGCEHDAVILRADAVQAARRKRETERAKARRCGV